jgi:hypothetical protein
VHGLQKICGQAQAKLISALLGRRQGSVCCSFHSGIHSAEPLPAEPSLVAASCMRLDEDRRGQKGSSPPGPPMRAKQIGKSVQEVEVGHLSTKSPPGAPGVVGLEEPGRRPLELSLG